jgi:glycosyltransferase involved in cell wall biosynthesis
VRLLRQILATTKPDLIEQAVARGITAGNAKQLPVRRVRLQARAVRDSARRTGNHGLAISEVLILIEKYPRVEEFQKICARLLHEAQDERAFAAWLGICLRFPGSMDSFHNLAVVAHRYGGPAVVRTVIEARFPRMPYRLDQLLAYAEASDLADADSERRAAFDRLAHMFGKRNDSWLTAASWLEEELGINRSATTFLRRLAAGTGLGPPIIRERQRLSSAIGDWERNGAATHDETLIASVKVLSVLFDRLLEARQVVPGARSNGKAVVSLLTGSLGVGGAERQLVNTAIGLSKMEARAKTLENGLVLDPINVVARSLRDRKNGSFFLGDLHQAGVEVRSYREFADFSGNLATSSVRPALSALGFLPWSTAEAVIKLTDWLRATQPEVVHIWQDGLVYAAGLAALLAGVPRIVLSGRSAPPPDRRERYLIEYDVIYKSLLRAPGVKLSVNSRHAAKRYAAWLRIDPDSITVIPNGVALPSSAADASSQAAYQAFEKRTGQARLTIGAVMRLDEVKRPLLWIDVAACLLARVSDVRFVIVGDGPLRTKVERRAEALGIAGRCLFVGSSDCIGFWLSKMDALMLLSEHEGLPNALIEAQLAGVPVITSPAGGAPETLLPDRTGIVTKPNPIPTDVADMIASLAAKPGLMRQMGVAAEQWAKGEFPISRMLTNTIELYSAAGRAVPVSAVPQDSGGARYVVQHLAR